MCGIFRSAFRLSFFACERNKGGWLPGNGGRSSARPKNSEIWTRAELTTSLSSVAAAGCSCGKWNGSNEREIVKMPHRGNLEEPST